VTSRSYTDERGRWRVRLRDDDTPSVHRVAARLEADVAAGERMPPSDVVLARLLDSARRDDDRPSEAMRRALFATARSCGLTRDDRLQLAEVVLRRDVETWNGLALAEAERLLCAMEGFALIAHLQAEQGRRWRYGACSSSSCPMRGDASASAAALTTDV
jgi:hypothetical protein